MTDKYEAIYKCPWCGEVPLDDDSVERILVVDEDLGNCPKCNRRSYASGIRAKFQARGEHWRGVYGHS